MGTLSWWADERGCDLRPKCPPGLTPQEYFRYYMPGDPPQTGCWLWTGPVRSDGYGQIRWRPPGGPRRAAFATHVAYSLFVGPLPDGRQLNHDCDTPLCVHPCHVYPGTQAENIRDMIDRGRQNFPGTPGEANGGAKLTLMQVGGIRKQYAEGGVSQRALAQQYGVSKTQIGRIVRYDKWAR